MTDMDTGEISLRDINGVKIYEGYAYEPREALCGCTFQVYYIRNLYGLVPRARIIKDSGCNHTRGIEQWRIE